MTPDRVTQTTQILRLAYLGNLGRAHDVPMLSDFLKACSQEVEVEIGFIGTTEAAIAPLRQLAPHHRFRLEIHPPIAFEKLGDVLPTMKFHYGLVSFSNQFLGLLSPSKFSGYLAAGLPIIYLGAPGTNAAIVCERFGGGFRFDRSALTGEVWRTSLERILWQREASTLKANVELARKFFEQYDGDYLARQIVSRLSGFGFGKSPPLDTGAALSRTKSQGAR